MDTWIQQIVTYSSLVGVTVVGLGLFAFVWASIRNGLINSDRNLAKSLGEENDYLVKKTHYLQQVIENYNRFFEDKQRQLNHLSAEIAAIHRRLSALEQVSQNLPSPTIKKTDPPPLSPDTQLPASHPIINKKPADSRKDYGVDNLTSILDEESRKL